MVDRVIVVAPTEHLKVQWAEAAATAGIPLDPAYSAGKGRTSDDYVGIAVTYAGVAVNPLAMRIRTERFKTLVILDEVHHAGDALSWGEAVREAFQPATRRLALTGTPFRSDVNPIPFVTYAPAPEQGPGALRLGARLHLRLRARAGRPRGAAGAVHGLLRRHAVAHPRRRRGRGAPGRAVDQGPVRAGAAHRARSGRRLDGRRARGRRPAALRGTPARARRRWAGDRDRPGRRPRLRLAAEADHRGEADAGALRREGRPRSGSPRSPPARTGGWSRSGWSPKASTCPGWRWASTPRRQRRRSSSPRPSGASCAHGGAARRRRCSCRRWRACSASPPRWSSSATTCWVARVSNEDDIFAAEADLLARAQAGEGASADELGLPFEALGSSATFDHVLFDGAAFGHSGEVHVGSEEEMDFLGIPGLLEPDQVRDLLAHRQSERARRRTTAPAGGATPRLPRAAGAAAPRAQRPRGGVAPPHRAGPRHHPLRAAQGVRRPAGRRRDGRPAARPDRPAPRVGRPSLTGRRLTHPLVQSTRRG